MCLPFWFVQVFFNPIFIMPVKYIILLSNLVFYSLNLYCFISCNPVHKFFKVSINKTLDWYLLDPTEHGSYFFWFSELHFTHFWEKTCNSKDLNDNRTAKAIDYSLHEQIICRRQHDVDIFILRASYDRVWLENSTKNIKGIINCWEQLV